MKALILVFGDGRRHLSMTTDPSFDTTAWAFGRREAFRALGVVGVEEYHPPQYHAV